MKKQIASLILILTLLFPLAFTPGCATSQQRQDTFTTLMMASSAGMAAYVTIATEKCKGDAVCEDNVNRTYSVYTNAVNALTAAYVAYETSPTNRLVVLNAITALNAAQMDIVKAILAAQQK